MQSIMTDYAASYEILKALAQFLEKSSRSQ